MSLIYCPECGHEISNSAVACPSCGRPIHAPSPTIERKVVVASPVRSDGGFPSWAFLPLGILGAVLLAVLFFVISRKDDSANSNLAVNVSTKKPAPGTRDVERADSQTVTAPPANDVQTVTVPGSQTTGSNPPAVPADKGSVLIHAKVAGKTGAPQAVKNEKFYLLDKDLESILNDADLEALEGQSLTNSLGLSVLYPERYGDFNRNALNAIRDHIKYSGQTDAAGKAQLGGVEPNGYYLFGVTKAGKGFAVWSSPVTIRTGENILNLTPQQITEMEVAG